MVAFGNIARTPNTVSCRIFIGTGITDFARTDTGHEEIVKAALNTTGEVGNGLLDTVVSRKNIRRTFELYAFDFDLAVARDHNVARDRNLGARIVAGFNIADSECTAVEFKVTSLDQLARIRIENRAAIERYVGRPKHRAVIGRIGYDKKKVAERKRTGKAGKSTVIGKDKRVAGTAKVNAKGTVTRKAVGNGLSAGLVERQRPVKCDRAARNLIPTGYILSNALPDDERTIVGEFGRTAKRVARTKRNSRAVLDSRGYLVVITAVRYQNTAARKDNAARSGFAGELCNEFILRRSIIYSNQKRLAVQNVDLRELNLSFECRTGVRYIGADCPGRLGYRIGTALRVVANNLLTGRIGILVGNIDAKTVALSVRDRTRGDEFVVNEAAVKIDEIDAVGDNDIADVERATAVKAERAVDGSVRHHRR